MKEKVKRIIAGIFGAVTIALLLCLTAAGATPDVDKQLSNYLLRLSGLMVAAFFMLIIFRNKIRATIIDILLLCFLILCILNYWLISPAPSAIRFTELLAGGMLYIGLRIVIAAERKFYYGFILCVLLICGFGEAITGIRQALGLAWSNHSLFRVTGSFFNPGPYGGYLAVILAILLSALIKYWPYINRVSKDFRRQSPGKKLCATGYAIISLVSVLIIVILPATMSRAAFLGLFAAVILMVAGSRYVQKYIRELFGKNRRLFTITIAAISAAIILGGIFLYFHKQDSANGRMLMWRVSSEMMADNLLTGVGFGAAHGKYADYQAAYFEKHPDSKLIEVAGSPEYGFNEYLQIGSELGIGGLILFLLLTITALVRLWRNKSIYACGLLSLLVFALFSYPFTLIPFQIFFILFLALAASCHGKSKAPVYYDKTITALLLLTFAFITALILPEVNRRIKATEEFKSLSYLYNSELYEDIIHDYRELYPFLYDNPRFLFEYGRTLHKLRLYEESNIVLQEGIFLSSDPMFYNIAGNNYKELGDVPAAEEFYLKAFNILPNRIYPYYLLMKLYESDDNMESALGMAEKILQFSPKVESSATKDIKQEASEIYDRCVKNGS